MAIAFLTTLAVQVGAAFINNKKNSQHSALIAQKQQAFEEKVAREGMENAQVELTELCALQREINEKMQKDRLDLINSNHKRSLMLDAYAESLKDWPLVVPPYVLKNDTLLSLGWSDRGVIPLNCILTTSTDSKFNNVVFYRLEEDIACFCSRYWNVSSNKSIRFLQETWRYTSTNKDVGSYHKDLYAHLADIPTLIISPVIMDGKLLFRFYWWGLSPDPEDAHLNDVANMFDPELSVSVGTRQIYTDDVVSRILAECTPKLEAFISYFADLYYWTFYKKVPSLPKLLYSVLDSLSADNKDEYNSQYRKMLADYSSLHDSHSNVRLLCDLLDSTKHALRDESEFMTIVKEHIDLKKSRGGLNCAEIPFLQRVLENFKLSPPHRAEIANLISKLKTTENIGFIPCAGRNEFLQKLHNICSQIGASSAQIKTVSSHIGIVTFTFGDEHIYSVDGLRFYIAVYPMMNMEADANFNNSLLQLTKKCVDKRLFVDFSTLGVDGDAMSLLLNQQTELVRSCSMVYDRLEDDIKGSKLPVIDLTYENVKDILAQQYESTMISEGYVMIAYSTCDDCYYMSILQYDNDKEIVAQYNCRSNSITTSLYNKIKNKAILKIRIK